MAIDFVSVSVTSVKGGIDSIEHRKHRYVQSGFCLLVLYMRDFFMTNWARSVQTKDVSEIQTQHYVRKELSLAVSAAVRDTA
jgi:hypothetical protein